MEIECDGFDLEVLMKIRNPQKCFTLVELLVVVSIIGILIAMIMPTLGKMRAKGHLAKCRENLRQLHVAAMNFTYGNDETRLPWAVSMEYLVPGELEDRWDKHTGWVDYVSPAIFGLNCSCGYRETRHKHGWTRWWGTIGMQSLSTGSIWAHSTKSQRIYICPTFTSDSLIGKKDPWGNVFTFDKPQVNMPVRSYVMNAKVANASIGSINCSRMLLFADMAHTNRVDGLTIAARFALQRSGNDQIQNHWAWDGELRGSNVTGQVYPYESVGVCHDGQAAGVFVDGHVEMIWPKQTTNACSGNW